jgi:1-deoxy-D-xylulose-5-phosphate synthase
VRFAIICILAHDAASPAERAKQTEEVVSDLEILDRIHSSADVKALPKEQLPRLCSELREEIINGVAKTGGHLASSLGAVELTVALHRVYDSSTDRIVFDVGHQCYAHKLLTGRRERFGTLRQFGGISGFPKPCESPDDAFISGHASASISSALGMARARTLQGEAYDVCAVIGDGALTGGLAYEGLANCGASGEPIVVVLNDNAMSIGENVGGLARLLARLRVRPGYIALKKAYHRSIGRYEHIYTLLHRIKERVKDLVLPDNMFENMGFYYLGPIDGHDIRTVTRTIRYAKGMRCPVLVHVLTVKGKGYPPAEQNPALYHGVGPFDPETGVIEEKKNSFSSVFGEALQRRAGEDRRIVAITAAMTDGTGLDGFAAQYPNRFFDVGIAEGHAVTMAAGMAKQGLRPVVAVYSSFLQRGFDQMLHDVALDRLPVVFAVDRAGIVGADGETHQGSFDVGYLCQIPGMSVRAPSDYAELQSMLSLALAEDGPAALRYPRGAEGVFAEDTSAADACVRRPGTDCTVVSYGILINEALAACETLEQAGISAELVKLNRLDAPDYDCVCASAAKTGRLLVAEDAAEAGCVGTRILAELERRGAALRAVRCRNLGCGVVPHGSTADLLRSLGLDAAGIAAACEELCR